MKTIKFKGKESGKKYEDTYRVWLDTFKEGVEKGNLTILNPPLCWVPFLKYTNIGYKDPVEVFPEDEWLNIDLIEIGWLDALSADRTREFVQFYAVLRPELVDGLWKYDCEWKVKDKSKERNKDFIITTTSAYFRPEMKEYMNRVYKFKSTKKNCVLTPCSADKPYPAKLHKEVMNLFPNKDWHLVVVSGVVGVAPEELWKHMPHYDAGIPNEWRILNTAADYFSRNKYDNIIVYLDYYNLTIAKVLVTMCNDMFKNTRIVFINPVGFEYNYTDLLSKSKLKRLKDAINGDY